MTERADWDAGRVEEIAAARAHLEGPLLPILHAVQAEYGYLPRESIPVIAKALNVTRAEVHGVVSFYHDFREQPPGTCVVKICRAEACQAMGCRDLTAHAEDTLGVRLRSGNDSVSLEPVYCLGNCACSPAVMIDDRPYGRVDKARFDALVAAFADGS